MKFWIASAVVVFCTFGSVSNAYTPVALSSVGMGHTRISAVVAPGSVKPTIRVSHEERRRVALLGMILMQARDLPVVH